MGEVFYWGETEEECRDSGQIEHRFKVDKDRLIFMEMVDKERRKRPYPHTDQDCHPDCKARGCGRLAAADSNWKLQFSHCQFAVQVNILFAILN